MKAMKVVEPQQGVANVGASTISTTTKKRKLPEVSMRGAKQLMKKSETSSSSF